MNKVLFDKTSNNSFVKVVNLHLILIANFFSSFVETIRVVQFWLSVSV